jgi:hypothetical protein
MTRTVVSKRSLIASRLPPIVKNKAECVPPSAEHLADPMAHVHPIIPAGASYWAMMNRENDGIALAQRDNGGLGLHSRPLLGQNKFTAGEVISRSRKQDCDL